MTATFGDFAWRHRWSLAYLTIVCSAAVVVYFAWG